MSLVLLFPGQGSQHLGMFDGGVSGTVKHQVLGKLAHLLPNKSMELSLDVIQKNSVGQPLIVAHALSVYESLKDLIPEPRFVLGYSVGELAACSVAGSYPPEKAIWLAMRRAELMDKYSPFNGGMLAVLGLAVQVVESAIKDLNLEICIENGPQHFVIGGPHGALDLAVVVLEGLKGSVVRRLPVFVSSHHKELQVASQHFQQILENSQLRAPYVPVISPVSVGVLRTGSEISYNLSSQLCKRLRFSDAVELAIEHGASCFLEIGAGQQLTAIVSALYPDFPVRPISAFRTPQGVAKWIGRHV